MKDNLRYYSHRIDSHRHPKFCMLRSLYGNGDTGWAAEAKFWALNNIIAESSECKLDIAKNRNKGVIARELDMALEDFNRFLTILKSEEVELITEVSPGVFTTEKVQESYEATKATRQRKRNEKKSSQELFRKNDISPDNSQNSGRKEESSGRKPPITKLNETKLNETKLVLLRGDDGFVCEPNFEDNDSVRDSIQNLFKDLKGSYDQRSDVNPLLEILSTIRENMTIQDNWQVINDSFIALKQANRADTAYLLGIIKRKMTAKHEEILKQIKFERKKSYAPKKKNEESPESFFGGMEKQYLQILEENAKCFSEKELQQYREMIESGNILNASMMIESRIEKASKTVG